MEEAEAVLPSLILVEVEAEGVEAEAVEGEDLCMVAVELEMPSFLPSLACCK